MVTESNKRIKTKRIIQEAMVDRNSGRAARELAEVIDQQPQSYDLNLTLGKLYRQVQHCC